MTRYLTSSETRAKGLSKQLLHCGKAFSAFSAQRQTCNLDTASDKCQLKVKLSRIALIYLPAILLYFTSPYPSTLTAQNSQAATSKLFQDQRSIDLNALLEPWANTTQWGDLQNISMGPDGQLYFFFINGYLSLNKDLSVSSDTLLSIFFSQMQRWEKNLGQYSLVSPKLLLTLTPNGNISLYNTHLGTWINTVREVRGGEQFRLYGRQLVTIQEQRALLYPDILQDEVPELIADRIQNAEYLKLLPNKQILYYERDSSALILTKAAETLRSGYTPPLMIIPPKEFYQKTPRSIGALSTNSNQSPQIFYGIFHNILVFFNHSGKNIFSIPLPSQAAQAYPIGSMLFLHLPSLGKVDIYSPHRLQKSYLPPQDELLLQQAVETGKRMEDQVLLEQAKTFYEWVIRSIDELLGRKDSESLYQLRVKISDSLDRIMSLLQTNPNFYFAIQKDLQGYRSLIQSPERFHNYRYQITLSLAWEGIQFTKSDLSYQGLLDFPWHLFFRLSSSKSLPQEELRILLEPSLDTEKSFIEGSSADKLQAQYFSFSFSP